MKKLEKPTALIHNKGPIRMKPFMALIIVSIFFNSTSILFAQDWPQLFTQPHL